jgi:histidyl-tRNA synthetase
MIFEPERVKGFQDFLTPESLKREKIVEIIKRIFKLYGFIPIETPVIEYEELMRSDTLGEEDAAISDRFKIKDKGGRSLGLRYEFTFQLARLFKQNPNLKLPFKRYQIGPVFRDEPVSSTRFRQFTQCDADIIGDPSVEAEAECIAAFNDIFKELNIKAEVQVNNRKLIDAILDSTKISQKVEVMRELDKLDKIGEDAVKVNLKKYADTNQVLTVFKLLEKNLDFFIKNMFEGAQEVKELIDLCRLYKIKTKFNPFMVRGLTYYTGNLFEARLPGRKESIAGGGRFDKTVGKYINKNIPATGWSMGLERISQIAEIKTESTKALLISLNQDNETIKLAQKLRKSNISCTIAFGKPTNALEYANAYALPYAVFIGEKEISQKKFNLKNLETGEEKLLSEKQLINKLVK